MHACITLHLFNVLSNVAKVYKSSSPPSPFLSLHRKKKERKRERRRTKAKKKYGPHRFRPISPRSSTISYSSSGRTLGSSRFRGGERHVDKLKRLGFDRRERRERGREAIVIRERERSILIYPASLILTGLWNSLLRHYTFASKSLYFLFWISLIHTDSLPQKLNLQHASWVSQLPSRSRQAETRLQASPVFRGWSSSNWRASCRERDREMEAHNWLGYAHLFQPDNGWTVGRGREDAGKIHVTLIFTRVRLHRLLLAVVAFRRGEHFSYRLLPIIPLLTLNTPLFLFFSLSGRRIIVGTEDRANRISIYILTILGFFFFF